uniref:Uncharacterized protein n=1 Tax=Timema genevievae TaxID=629358 RepID=A0A7R9K0V6_TIMGE|nr:unnamed protein product [Timema genevievae]
MNSQLVNNEMGICMDGEIFLVKMAALIFLRGLRRYDSIQIAHNLASAGIFRHIVVRFEDSSGKVGTKFIQLKLGQGKSNIVSREQLFALSEHDVLTWRASNGDASRLMRYVNTGSTGHSDNLEEFMEKCNTIAPQTNTVWDIPDRVVLISGEPGIGKSYLVNQLALQSKKARPETWINVCVDGVPLHSIMFSEAFEERLTTFQNTGNVEIPDKIDLIELLIKLVRKHRDIYYEKYNFEMNNYDLSENADIYVGYHVRSALQAILPPGHLSQLHDRTIEERNMPFIKRLQGGETTTFIQGIIDGRPQFSHRVYAEFFASLWFVKYFRQNRDFIEQNFHTWEYREIRFMFDRELVSGHEIHEAILKGDIASVRTHLFRKANVNATDLGGRTPLHVLASLPPSIITSGEPSAVFEELTLTLLRAGADVKLTDHVLGKDPFYYIYKNSVWIMYVVWLRRMLSHEDPAYKQLLQVYKADYPMYLAAINGHLELITVALEMDLPPNTVVIDTNQSTILHGAAFTGHLKIVDLLIKHGADLNVRDAEGMSALMLAAGEDHLDVVRSLTDHKVDLDLQNNTGNCALHLAAEKGHLGVVKCLVRAGCTINVINNKGETPLDCAKSIVRDSRVRNKDYTNRLKSVVRYLADATCMTQASLVSLLDDDRTNRSDPSVEGLKLPKEAQPF